VNGDDDGRTQASSSRTPVDTLPTQVMPMGPRTRTGSPTRTPTKVPSHSGSSTVGSPLEAMERDELLRTRRFCFIATGICACGSSSVFVLPGDPTATAVLLGAVTLTLAAIAFMYNRTRDPFAFRKPSTSLGWFIPAACVTSAIPYFGCFSPAPVVLVLGIYFTGLGKSTRVAWAVYVVCAGAQALVSVLVIFGIARDTGVLRVRDLSLHDMIVIQALVQFVLGATFVTARVSRRTALLAVGELERAVRIAAHREALLLEARDELDRAMKSTRGRFTDQVIGGYTLGQVLGRGAMGEVYGAEGPNGSAAIKLLSQASLGNPNHVLRFLRELRTAANLKSPNIVEVLEVGEQPVPYLVMERLEGQTLAEILRGRRNLAPPEVCDLVRQVGNGITAAGNAGIIHRDLKPQNVFLDRGVWKILDFGIARAVDQSDTLTSGHVVGTPSYMAPEQASGGSVEHSADLYALTAIAYRAITGQPPYPPGEVAETLYKVVHTSPPRPSLLTTSLPPEVDLVLAIGLAKRAADRFATAGEFADALTEAFAGTISPHLRARGEDLSRAGAWAKAPRASTARIRPG
jgi:serine/threonine-protein kinase